MPGFDRIFLQIFVFIQGWPAVRGDGGSGLDRAGPPSWKTLAEHFNENETPLYPLNPLLAQNDPVVFLCIVYNPM